MMGDANMFRVPKMIVARYLMMMETVSNVLQV